jgi:hypothetical protein
MTKKILLNLRGLVLILVIVLFSGCLSFGKYNGAKPVFGYGGSGGGWIAPAPIVIPPAILARVGEAPTKESIGPYGNILTVSTFRNGETVTIDTTSAAFGKDIKFRSQMTTISIGRIIGGVNGSFVLGNAVFNLTARDANKNIVKNFGNNDVTVMIYLPKLPNDTKGLGLYAFNYANSQWVLVSGARFDALEKRVIFQTNYFTTFAVIKNMNEKVAPLIKKEVEKVATKKEEIKTVVKKEKVKVVAKTTTKTSPKKEDPRDRYEDGTILSLNNKDLYMVSGDKLIKINNNENLRSYTYGDIINITAKDLEKYQK